MSKRNISEQGRSMVEILGVLSIMGILSLVGLKMYHSAVNSHRANELIYEANKRATMVAAQLMAGRSGDQLSIAEFTDPAGHTFGVEVNPKNANQFNITITGVDSEVCQKMKNTVGDGTAIRLISDFCDKLTYNNDLSTKAYSSDIQTATECTNASHTWCGGTGVCQEPTCATTDTDCQAQVCCTGVQVNECQVCNKGAIMSSPQEGKTCTYRDGETQKTGICHLGTCEPAATGMTCDANNFDCTCTVMEGGNPVMVDGNPLQGHVCSMDRTNNAVTLCCRMNELCNNAGEVNTTNTTNQAKCITLAGADTQCSTNADCTDPAKPWCKITQPSGITVNCRDPSNFKGTCTSITTTTNGGVTASETSVYGLGNVIVSSSGMNWWSAKNWCEANGKKLINIEAFQVYYYDSGVNRLVTTGSGTRAACKQGKTCTYWNSSYAANAMWKNDGKVLTDAKDESGELYSAKYSPVVLDLAQKYRGSKNYFWTASDYNKTDSCYAFLVYVNDGYVANLTRYSSNSALCE